MTRHQRRRQIAAVIARHGLTGLLSLSGLGTGRRPAGGRAGPRELRLALAELGPTFVKLGQLASTRADLLGPEYRAELAKLQDAAPPIASAAALAVVDASLHGRQTAFASFERQPLAAASIGQAHAATLRDGTEVVVKIRRPGAAELVELDLEILHECAVHAVRRSEVAELLDLVGLVEEFAAQLRSELDYMQEGRNADRFAANFAADPDVQVPRVFWEATTSRVITVERIRGLKVTDLDALAADGIDRHDLAERAMRITAKMVFEDEFFHGDPHPGNFFVEPGGRIGLIDFGLVGVLDDRTRDNLTQVLLGVARNDPTRLTDALLALAATTAAVNRARLRDDVADLLARYAGRPLGDLSLGAALEDFLRVARRHHLRLPSNLALLAKVTAMGEGLATELDPSLRIDQVLAPYVRRTLLSRLSTRALERHVEQLGIDVADLAAGFPGELHRALRVLGDGDLGLHLRADELEPFVARVERAGNRIAGSVLAGALLLSGSAYLRSRRT